MSPLLHPVPLDAARPFDAPGVLRFLATRALPGVELADVPPSGPLRYARTLALPHGPGAVEVAATPTGPTPGDWSVEARLELADATDADVALDLTRRLLGLRPGHEPAVIDRDLATDPALAASVAATPGIRVPGAVDPDEMLVRAIVGQQISVAAARTHLGRLATALGTPYASALPGLDRLFPTAAQIAAGVLAPAPGDSLDPDRPLRLPGRAIRTVATTASALASGDLTLDPDAPSAQLQAALVARPGIGPWTAAYVALRVLGDPDAWMIGDVALLAGASALGILDPAVPRPAAHGVLAAHAERWAPWRSYASMHVWRATSAPGATRGG